VRLSGAVRRPCALRSDYPAEVGERDVHVGETIGINREGHHSNEGFSRYPFQRALEVSNGGSASHAPIAAWVVHHGGCRRRLPIVGWWIQVICCAEEQRHPRR